MYTLVQQITLYDKQLFKKHHVRTSTASFRVSLFSISGFLNSSIVSIRVATCWSASTSISVVRLAAAPIKVE